MSLKVDIVKKLGDFRLEVAFETGGQPMGILGASGCGKSMTLKCIAGIESPDQGVISVDGRVLYDSAGKINLRPQQRRVGFLFQDYALFPNMTVAQNIGCGMRQYSRWQNSRRQSGQGQPERQRLVMEMIGRYRLAGLADRYPHQLSGGQQQRAALARMLASQPAVVLLDEPFSALDAHLREQMQLELMDVLAGQRNAIMVTHSRDEVYKLCDELLVMEDGRAVAKGMTKAMFRTPGAVRVARLTGCKNISRARRVDRDTVEALDWGLRLRAAAPVGEEVRYVGIRAHDFEPVFDTDSGTANLVRVNVLGRTEDPFEWNILFRNGGDSTLGDADSGRLWWKYSKQLHTELPPYLRVPPEALLLLTE